MSLIEYIPLQQGLRLIRPKNEADFDQLIEYIPLQQGLRHCETCILIITKLIEYIPLQQGLRRKNP